MICSLIKVTTTCHFWFDLGTRLENVVMKVVCLLMRMYSYSAKAPREENWCFWVGRKCKTIYNIPIDLLIVILWLELSMPLLLARHLFKNIPPFFGHLMFCHLAPRFILSIKTWYVWTLYLIPLAGLMKQRWHSLLHIRFLKDFPGFSAGSFPSRPPPLFYKPWITLQTLCADMEDYYFNLTSLNGCTKARHVSRHSIQAWKMAIHGKGHTFPTIPSGKTGVSTPSQERRGLVPWNLTTITTWISAYYNAKLYLQTSTQLRSVWRSSTGREEWCIGYLCCKSNQF